MMRMVTRSGTSKLACRTSLAADRVHGTRRRNEFRGVDLVAEPLLRNVRANRAGNRVIRRAGAKQSLYVGLVDGEKAITKLAIRSQADSIAVEAEGLAHRCNQAHAPGAVFVKVLCRGSPGIAIGRGHKRGNLF